MRTASGLLFVGLIVAMCLPAQGSHTDFEGLVARLNIHGLDLGGITLYEPQLEIVRVYANNAFGAFYHSPVNSVGSDESVAATYAIIGVFDAPQRFISLWAGDDGGDTDQWELEAFDAPVGGTSLGLVQSDPWSGNPSTQLSISAEGIRRFEARSLGPDNGIAYDDLDFYDARIPAPGAVLLGAIGLGFVPYLRRRMAK